MILSLLTLSLFFIIWIFVFFFYKEQKKIYGINALLIIIIFIGPAVYYFLGGTSYRIFSDDALIKYHYLSSTIFFINTLFLIVKNKIKISSITKFLDQKAFSQFTILTKIYFVLMFLFCLTYIILFFNKFPLIVFLKESIIIDRPDGTGTIPHFYTMSTIMMMVFPSVFFILHDAIKNNKFFKFIMFLIIILFMTIAGHKGLVVFFFIFYWFYILNRKINLKFISLFIISIIIYAIAKGRINFSEHNLTYLMNSSFVRMFVTQGAGLIARIHLISTNYNFVEWIPIKNQVCSLVYHVKINTCSMPTYFIGDIIVNYGYFIALLLYIVLGIPLLYILKIADNFYSKSVFIKWNIFILFFLFSMAEISIYSLLRLTAMILNVLIVYYLSRTHIVKTENAYKIKFIKNKFN